MVIQNFIKLQEKGATANATSQIDLDNLKTEFNTTVFNTLTLLNTSTNTPIILILDGRQVAYIPANNGTFEIKPEYLLKYSLMAIKNDTANVLTTELKIIIGLVGAY